MNPIRQYIEELCEVSYTSSDIPDKFYIVLRPNSDEETFEELANFKLKGVKGVSATRKIMPEQAHSARHNFIAIEMNGNEFERINNLSRVLYKNPDYLVSNDFAALRRLTETTSSFGALEQIGAAFRNLNLPSKDAVWLRNGFTYTNGKSPFLEIARLGGVTGIKSMNDLVNWIWMHREKNQGFEEATRQGIDKALRLAIISMVLSYDNYEQEWLIKKEWIEGKEEHVMRIPNGSRLILKKSREQTDDTYSFSPRNETLVQKYGLDRKYRITWLNTEKYTSIAKTIRTQRSREEMQQIEKWKDDARKQVSQDTSIAAESFWLEGLDLSEATLYHGSKFPDIVECEEGICLAYNRHVADEYASDLYDFGRMVNPGDIDDEAEEQSTVYVVDVPSNIKVAKTIDLRRAYSNAYLIPMKDIQHVVMDVYELADDEKVRKELRNQGFDAIQYMDESPTMKRHKTLRILNPSVVKIIDKQPGKI